MNLRRKGFTLIELMIVITIIAVVVAIAIPKFGRLVIKSREANTKGNLGTIRSALSVYYGNTDGLYPTDNLGSLLIGERYLPLMPFARLPTSPNNNGHEGDLTAVLTGTLPGGVDDVADGVSGWFYDNVAIDAQYGRVIVNCTHSDFRGDLWTSF